MKESFRIRLLTGDTLLPVEDLTTDGLTFRGEADAWPRGLALEFDAASDATALRMKWIRELKGWHPWEFKLSEFVERGSIGFKGDDDASLPAGSYWLRLRIGDLIIRGGRQRLAIEEGKQVSCDVPVAENPRRVVLKEELSTWDAQIRSVLEADAQKLDGLSVSAWLKSRAPRESRKACLLNLMAKLRTVPSRSEPFLLHIKRIFLADVERIYVVVGKEFRDRLSALAKDESKLFYFEGKPASASHLRLLRRVVSARLEPDVQGYTLESYRQTGRNSMQVVVAIPPKDRPNGGYYADIDIDLGNPLQDVQGFLIHMGELLSEKSTDHLKLHDQLAKGPTADFLYYDVVRS